MTYHNHSIENYSAVINSSVDVLFKMVLTFDTLDETIKCDIRMKAAEQNFPVVMFIAVCKVVLILRLWMKS